MLPTSLGQGQVSALARLDPYRRRIAQLSAAPEYGVLPEHRTQVYVPPAPNKRTEPR